MNTAVNYVANAAGTKAATSGLSRGVASYRNAGKYN